MSSKPKPAKVMNNDKSTILPDVIGSKYNSLLIEDSNPISSESFGFTKSNEGSSSYVEPKSEAIPKNINSAPDKKFSKNDKSKSKKHSKNASQVNVDVPSRSKKKKKSTNAQPGDDFELLEQATKAAESAKEAIFASVFINDTDDALKARFEMIRTSIEYKITNGQSIVNELDALIELKFFAPLFLHLLFQYFLDALCSLNFFGALELLDAVRKDPMIPFPEALIDMSFYYISELSAEQMDSFDDSLQLARFVREFVKSRLFNLDDQPDRNEGLTEAMDEAMLSSIDKHFNDLKKVDGHFENVSFVFNVAIQKKRYNALKYLMKKMILSGTPGGHREMSKAMPETKDWKGITYARFHAASESLDHIIDLNIVEEKLSPEEIVKHSCSLTEILGELSEVLLYTDGFPPTRPIKNVDPMEYKAALRMLIKNGDKKNDVLLSIWKQRPEWRFYHSLLLISYPSNLWKHSKALAGRMSENQEILLLLRDLRKLVYHTPLPPSLHLSAALDQFRVGFLETSLTKYRNEPVVTDMIKLLDEHYPSTYPLNLRILGFYVNWIENPSISEFLRERVNSQFSELLDRLLVVTLMNL
jgi:hypothetical protein